ncbi:hypothetical protein U1Q18_004950 [Sarracenia purpurea var. burkii]
MIIHPISSFGRKLIRPTMASYWVALSLSAVLTALIVFSSAAPSTIPPRNQDLLIAIEEMQRANYFTFVVLINMAPPSLLLHNVTFLMPNDRTLAKNPIPVDTVADFLLRQSIPSPLLFDHLIHFPTGSVIPTAKPGFTLKITNHGRKGFYLNNVRIISPNLCTAGFSIRCHGVDGVVQQATVLPGNSTTSTTPPPPTCSNCSRPAAEATPPVPSWPSPEAPADGGFDPSPGNAPPPSGQNSSTSHRSGSSRPLPFGGLSMGKVIAWLKLLTIK